MAKKPERIPMYHPTKKDENGRAAIMTINAQTVKSGKAAKMGFTRVDAPEQAPKAVTPPAKVTDPKGTKIEIEP